MQICFPSYKSLFHRLIVSNLDVFHELIDRFVGILSHAHLGEVDIINRLYTEFNNVSKSLGVISSDVRRDLSVRGASLSVKTFKTHLRTVNFGFRRCEISDVNLVVKYPGIFPLTWYLSISLTGIISIIEFVIKISSASLISK